VFHFLDKPRGAVIAYLEPALYKTGAGFALLMHYFQSLIVEGIVAVVEKRGA
jgi:hypothetical protein